MRGLEERGLRSGCSAAATGRAGAQSGGPRTLSQVRTPALAAAASDPLPSRAGPGAPLEAVFMPEPPRRGGSGRGGARRGGEGAAAAGRRGGGGGGARCPAGAGGRRGAAAGGRAVAELTAAAAGALLWGFFFSPFHFFFRFKLPALPSQPGEAGLPHARRCRQPCPGGQRCSPLLPHAAAGPPCRAGRRVSLRVPAGGRRQGSGSSGFSQGRKPPSPATGFSAPAAAVQLCGHRVTTPGAMVRADGAGGTSGRRRGAGARVHRGEPGPCPPRGGERVRGERQDGKVVAGGRLPAALKMAAAWWRCARRRRDMAASRGG